MQAAFPPGDAREDWTIVRAFSETVDKTLPFHSLAELRGKMFEAAPVLSKIGQRPAAEWKAFGAKGEVSAQAFVPAVKNFYMTDPISRASVTMAKCTAEIMPYWAKKLEAAE